ncbi:PEP/pyruvate-binding domain-containing protein [Butyrivibrio sp. FC2001]|uniref:PEP/pyruvate-binding domain-containing protein n=1 Tax=Butyrivibrio sp. FC2001 TaxID=1280671 RepID=UPI000419FD9B|nr:PEP/pyruvate-binding domain-containing protein [Butyrivibrio sp. FC2001]
MIHGSKADTLKMLEGIIHNAKIFPQVSFTVKEWLQDSKCIMDNIMNEFNSTVIIRSSCHDEDTSENSNAGRFLSIPNVKLNIDDLHNAIEKVIVSYNRTDYSDQVLVQTMLNSPVMCGVAFTLDPNTGGDYYVVNYDTTGSTESVTSGDGNENHLFYFHKSKNFNNICAYSDDTQNKRLSKLCSCLAELEGLFEENNLDVEFAFDKNENLYILQVRPLVMRNKLSNSELQKKELERISEYINNAQKKRPFLCGKNTIYSVMTDWNPAEMIGIRPKPLALSLYRELITDNVWAYQRDNYGYRNLRSFPLLVDFGGCPYIDVRVSFNSFIPATLSDSLSEKLVNYYIDLLKKNPKAHDKAEFDIVFSCYTFDLEERIKVLREYGFSKDEISQIVDSLCLVTKNITDFERGLWRKDEKKIEILEKRYYELMDSNLNDIDRIYWLLEDCKRYGTLPFAGLARGAFIAVQILKSMVSVGIISEDEYSAFMNSVNTVSSRMNDDFIMLSKEGFLKKYGHLRPGTYDISSKRYDEAPDMYFDWIHEKEQKHDRKMFKLSLSQMKELRKRLQESGLSTDVIELLEFIKCVIEGREFGKFVFTRNVSEALRILKHVGKEYGISEEEMSYANIHVIQELYSSTKNAKEIIHKYIEEGRAYYDVTKQITLPPVVTSNIDIWQFEYPDTEPNYITTKKACAEVVCLDDDINSDIEGRIVLIKSADPGYDWIFSHDIKGFITMYGGANSHMAIRAGELEIPAAVGVGEKSFFRLKQASIVALNALEKNIQIIRRDKNEAR